MVALRVAGTATYRLQPLAWRHEYPALKFMLGGDLYRGPSRVAEVRAAALAMAASGAIAGTESKAAPGKP